MHVLLTGIYKIMQKTESYVVTKTYRYSFNTAQKTSKKCVHNYYILIPTVA